MGFICSSFKYPMAGVIRSSSISLYINNVFGKIFFGIIRKPLFWEIGKSKLRWFQLFTVSNLCGELNPFFSCWFRAFNSDGFCIWNPDKVAPIQISFYRLESGLTNHRLFKMMTTDTMPKSYFLPMIPPCYYKQKMGWVVLRKLKTSSLPSWQRA